MKKIRKQNTKKPIGGGHSNEGRLMRQRIAVDHRKVVMLTYREYNRFFSSGKITHIGQRDRHFGRTDIMPWYLPADTIGSKSYHLGFGWSVPRIIWLSIKKELLQGDA